MCGAVRCVVQGGHKEFMHLCLMFYRQTRAKMAAEESTLEALDALIAERMKRVQQKVREMEWVEEDILQCFTLLVQAKRDEVARCEAEYERLMEEKEALLHPKPPTPKPTPKATPRRGDAAAKKPRQRKAPVKRSRGKNEAAAERKEEANRDEEEENEGRKRREEKEENEQEERTREAGPADMDLQTYADDPLLSPLQLEEESMNDGQSRQVTEAELERKYDDDGDDDAELLSPHPTPPSPPSPPPAASPSTSTQLDGVTSTLPERKTRRGLTPALSTSVSASTASSTIASASTSSSPALFPLPSLLFAPSAPASLVDSPEQAASKKPKRSLTAS